MTNKVMVAHWDKLEDRVPKRALIAGVDGVIDDLTTFKIDMAQLSGVVYGGVGGPR